jgi:ABC-type antimicrobial peptide transport system permease subunit
VLESIIIAVLGGALGCAIGSLADGWTANSIAGGQGGGKFIVLRTAVTWLTLGEGMLLSLVMGGLGGFFPALSAMWLRPLEAMR